MKHLILLFAMFIACSSILAFQKDADIQVIMRGTTTEFAPSNVHVVIRNNFVVTTFNKAVNNVTVTVKKKTGEVIEKENLNAKTFDQVPVKIDNYKEGNYTIEIETEEGKLEGEF